MAALDYWNDPANQGILTLAANMMANSGPQALPHSFLADFGKSSLAGMNAFQGAQNQNLARALQQQQLISAQLANRFAGFKSNLIDEIQGTPGQQGPQDFSQTKAAPPSPTALPTTGSVPAPSGAPTGAPAGSMAPRPTGFDQMTAHLPPEAQTAARLALMSGDMAGFSKLVAEGHLKNVQGVGLMRWDRTKGDWTLPAAQEEGVKARKQAEQDVADANKPDTYRFGNRDVQTNAAIANALRTGVAPDQDTAMRAIKLANAYGYNANVNIRNQGGDAVGLTGPRTKESVSTPAELAAAEDAQRNFKGPGALQTPEEKARDEARAKFLGGRAEGAVKYEQGLNEKVGQGVQLDSRIDEQLRLIKDFKSGGGAQVRARLAEAAQAINAPKEVVDGIANGNLGSIQAFEKLQIQGAMESLRQAMATSSGAGAGRITQAEFQIFMKANPNINLDPRGLEKIQNFIKWTVSVDKAEQQAYNQWIKNKDNDPADFPAEFAANRSKYLKGIENPKGTEPVAKTYSKGDLAHTAMKYKITVEEARKRLEGAGYKEQ